MDATNLTVVIIFATAFGILCWVPTVGSLLRTPCRYINLDRKAQFTVYVFGRLGWKDFIRMKRFCGTRILKRVEYLGMITVITVHRETVPQLTNEELKRFTVKLISEMDRILDLLNDCRPWIGKIYDENGQKKLCKVSPDIKDKLILIAPLRAWYHIGLTQILREQMKNKFGVKIIFVRHEEQFYFYPTKK